jgi:hypothetical protein
MLSSSSYCNDHNNCENIMCNDCNENYCTNYDCIMNCSSCFNNYCESCREVYYCNICDTLICNTCNEVEKCLSEMISKIPNELWGKSERRN